MAHWGVEGVGVQMTSLVDAASPGHCLCVYSISGETVGGEGWSGGVGFVL